MKYVLDKAFAEQYSQKYSQTVCDKLFATQSFVRGEQLSAISTVHQVNQLLIKEIFSTWQSEAQRLQSPIFDYQAPEVQKAFRDFMNLLAHHIKINRNHFEPLLQKATYQTLLYLIEPLEFLRQFVKKHQSWEKEIFPTLRYLKFHPNLIEKWKQEIKKAQFQRTLSLDEIIAIAQTLLEQQPSLANTDIEPVIEEFSAVLPISAKALLQEESGETIFDIERFERELGFANTEPSSPTKKTTEETKQILTQIQNQVKKEILEEEIQSQKNTVISESNTKEMIAPSPSKKTPTQEEIYQEYLQNMEKQKRGISGASLHALQSKTAQPIESKLAFSEPESQKISSVENKSIPETPSPTSPSHTPLTLAEKLAQNAQQKQTLADRLVNKNSNKQVSIKTMLTLHDRIRFQNELFGKNIVELNDALEMIDNCKDYHTALALVKEKYMLKYHWNLNAEVTIDFFKLINKRF
ncbi:MAG: hypothetical protein NZM38_06835 [Cytophagales bacterium]|nr:hypothetical protein [Cytophagales bacterium]MDW8384472.1 hypothetical protein [Flammeovirgaceae bacterium]